MRNVCKYYYFLLVILTLLSCNTDIFDDESNNYITIYETFCDEVDRHYSFFTYLDFDWDSVQEAHLIEIDTCTSDNVLYATFSEILNCFDDPHTNIISPLGTGGNTNYFSQFPSNEIDYTYLYFSYYVVLNNCIQYGWIKNTKLGYIKIKTFEDEIDEGLFAPFDSIVNIFSETEGLIIDLRSNTGGRINNASLAINNFIDSSRTAFQYRYRNGLRHNDFSDWVDYELKTDAQYNQYTKEIALLTNRKSYSATEWFIAMAAVLPNTTIIGDTTGGGSGIPLLRELPNGWVLRISNSQFKLPSGRDFQFEGIYPDIPIWLSDADYYNNTDAILEKAIEVLEN